MESLPTPHVVFPSGLQERKYQRLVVTERALTTSPQAASPVHVTATDHTYCSQCGAQQCIECPSCTKNACRHDLKFKTHVRRSRSRSDKRSHSRSRSRSYRQQKQRSSLSPSRTKMPACEALLQFTLQQIAAASKHGNGCVGIRPPGDLCVTTPGMFPRTELRNGKWRDWHGAWDDVMTYVILDALMSYGFDVFLPGQVSVAQDSETFSLLGGERHTTVTCVVPARPVKTIKHGFVVAWLDSAVETTRDPNTGELVAVFSDSEFRSLALESVRAPTPRRQGTHTSPVPVPRLAHSPRNSQQRRDSPVESPAGSTRFSGQASPEPRLGRRSEPNLPLTAETLWLLESNLRGGTDRTRQPRTKRVRDTSML